MKRSFLLTSLLVGVLSFSSFNFAFAIEESADTKEEINKNILTPNESPGIMTDTNRIRRYYNSLKNARETKLDKTTEQLEQSEIKPLCLPARIEENQITTLIKKVELSHSEIFSKAEINEFKRLAEGENLTAEDINNLVQIINEQYAKKNIITARASIESLEGGVLKIELMEAKIGKVEVKGNKFNRKWFLKRQISSKASNILNLQVLENDLKNFNKQAKSIKLSAKLQPGEEYGTTDIILQAEEKFPYHFSASWDSFGRETTGLLRSGLMLSADSFLGFQDRLTGAVNLSRSSTNPFVDYNIPLNKYGTRLGGSYMYGRSKVTSGEYSSFDLGANTHIFSTYITHPLIDSGRLNLNLNTSANIKLSNADIGGYEYSKYKDYNIAIGTGGRYNFDRGVLFGSVYATNGLIENKIASNSEYFAKFNADAYYVHYLPKGIILTFRAGGQYSPCDVPFVEQYQIGGISSVRGYSESLLLASNSYFASTELLLPIPILPEEINIPFRRTEKFALRNAVKFALFVDNGAIFPDSQKVKTTNFLTSIGAGLRLAISKYVTARGYVGMPLMNTSIYSQSNARFHFDIVTSLF